MKVAYQLSFFFFFFLSHFNLQAQQIKTNIDTTLLQKRIPELMDSANVTGASVAIVKNGKLYWHKGFGVKNVKTKEPVTDNTMYEVASLSKPMFAYIVLQLVERGILDLDKPLVEYIPYEVLE